MNKFGFIVLACALVAVSAEAPRFRQRSNQRFFARQEIETTTNADEATTIGDAPYPAAEAPYPAAGGPTGARLVLPSRQEEAQEEPQDSYGPPAETEEGPYPAAVAPYPAAGGPQGARLILPARQEQAPQQAYGAPQQSYGTPEEESTTTESSDDETTTTEPDSEDVELGPNEAEALTDGTQQRQQQQQQQFAPQSGAYYILPSGAIQPIVYLASPQIQSAKLQAVPAFANQIYVPKSVSFNSQYVQQSW